MNTTIEHDAAVDGMHDPRADSVVRSSPTRSSASRSWPGWTRR